MSPESRQKVLDAIRESLPGAYFKLKDQKVYAPHTLHNQISNGTGPPVVEIRGQKFLERDSYMEWLAGTPGLKRGRKRAACQKAV